MVAIYISDTSQSYPDLWAYHLLFLVRISPFCRFVDERVSTPRFAESILIQYQNYVPKIVTCNFMRLMLLLELLSITRFREIVSPWKNTSFGSEASIFIAPEWMWNGFSISFEYGCGFGLTEAVVNLLMTTFTELWEWALSSFDSPTNAFTDIQLSHPNQLTKPSSCIQYHMAD